MSSIGKRCVRVTSYIRQKTGDKDVELVRGKDYFYFAGGKADHFNSQGVYVSHLGQLTPDQWVAEYNRRVADES